MERTAAIVKKLKEEKKEAMKIKRQDFLESERVDKFNLSRNIADKAQKRLDRELS